MARHQPMSGYTVLSDRPGDIHSVRKVLAEWGLDKATIDRVLREHRMSQDVQRARKVRKILAEWGLDRATIDCILRGQRMNEAPGSKASLLAKSVESP